MPSLIDNVKNLPPSVYTLGNTVCSTILYLGVFNEAKSINNTHKAEQIMTFLDLLTSEGRDEREGDPIF